MLNSVEFLLFSGCPQKVTQETSWYSTSYSRMPLVSDGELGLLPVPVCWRLQVVFELKSSVATVSFD